MKKLFLIFFLLVVSISAQWSYTTPYQVDTALISTSQTVAGVGKDLAHRRLGAILIDIDGTSKTFTSFTFQGSTDGTNYYDLQVDSSGTLSDFYWVADTMVVIPLDPLKTFPFRYIKPKVDAADESDDLVIYLFTVGL